MPVATAATSGNSETPPDRCRCICSCGFQSISAPVHLASDAPPANGATLPLPQVEGSSKEGLVDLKRSVVSLQASVADDFIYPHSGDVIRHWDVEQSSLFWSFPRTELVLGYGSDKVPPTVEWWREHLHPDERKEILTSIEHFLDNPEARFWAEEYRLLGADGCYITVVDQLRSVQRHPVTGRATRIVGILFNPVQRQQIEDILHSGRANLLRDLQQVRFSDSTQLLQAVAENSVSGLVMTDGAGRVKYMNRAAEQFSGWELSEIKDTHLHNAMHYKYPDGRPFPIDECHVDYGEDHRNVPDWWVTKDGRLFPVRWSLQPLYKGTRIVGTVLEFRDITKELALEEERLRLTVEKEAEKARGLEIEAHRDKMAQFVDYVCHEMRNPLHGISASAEFLADSVVQLQTILDSTLKELDESVSEPISPHSKVLPLSPSPSSSPPSPSSTLVSPHPYKPSLRPVLGIRTSSEENFKKRSMILNDAEGYIKSIRECCSHQSLIINNVLDLSRLEAGKVELLSDTFDPVEMAESCLRMLTARVTSKGIQATTQAYEGIRLIKGDSMRYCQVLMNLTSNAVKFTPNSKSVTIIIHAPEPDPDDPTSLILRTIVVDTGIGMDSSELANLFQRFGQLNKRISRDYGGSGLGLNISRELVTLLGGDFIVRSAKDVGTEMEFTVRMKRVTAEEEAAWKRQPRRRTASRRGGKRRGSAISSGSGSEWSAPHATRRKFSHVLVVEDNIINQMVITTYLKRLQYTYTVCSNGREAVDAFVVPGSGIDCCIMDMEMPVMDGREATRRIRDHEAMDEFGVPPTTIIALSGNALPRQMQSAYDTGLDDYLTKPCSQIELQNMLSKWEDTRLV